MRKLYFDVGSAFEVSTHFFKHNLVFFCCEYIFLSCQTAANEHVVDKAMFLAFFLPVTSLADNILIMRSNLNSLLSGRLQEELKLKNTNLSSDAEQQIGNLRQEVYELEGNVRKLNIQNEELQFAYEQELERRQVEEEERCRADQKARYF